MGAYFIHQADTEQKLWQIEAYYRIFSTLLADAMPTVSFSAILYLLTY